MWIASQNPTAMKNIKSAYIKETAAAYTRLALGLTLTLLTLDFLFAYVIGYESISARCMETVLTKVIGG
jgi:hypothetical protein